MLGYTEAEAISRPASRFWVGFDNNPYGDERHRRSPGPRRMACAKGRPSLLGSGGDRATAAIVARVVRLRRDPARRHQAVARRSRRSRQHPRQLEQRTIELGRFNRLASGRELRMIELKRMVNERSTRLGMDAPFDLSFADEFADVPRPGESL